MRWQGLHCRVAYEVCLLRVSVLVCVGLCLVFCIRVCVSYGFV